MYQVSERVKKQFEYTMSIPCVKEAMKFIQEDERGIRLKNRKNWFS